MRARSAFRLLSAAARHRIASGRSTPALPYKINLHLTYECDSRCASCRIWELYRVDPPLKGRELDTGQWLRIVDGIASHAVWLAVSGGEPTLREDLSEIVCRALRICSRLALVNIPVNGLDPDRTHRLFEPIAREAKGIPIYVAVSLDGLGKAQDEIRGVAGAYAAARETFSRLRALESGHNGFHALFQVTLSARNRNAALDLLEFARERSLAIVHLAHESYYYRNEGTGVDVRRSLGPDEGFVRSLRRSGGWWPVEAIPPRLYLTLAAIFLREGRAPIPCSAGSSSATIDPFGRVLPCPYLDRPLGDLSSHGYELARLLATRESRQTMETVRDCRACWQNCEAQPSMLDHPFSTLFLASREWLRGGRQVVP